MSKKTQAITHEVNPPIMYIVGMRKNGTPIGNFWGLRKGCGEPLNHWGNLSKAINPPSLALKLSAKAVIGLPAIPTAPWMAGPGPKSGSGYWAHTRDFKNTNNAFKYLAKYFGLCACDKATSMQLKAAGVKWIPICGNPKSKTLKIHETKHLTQKTTIRSKKKIIYIEEGPANYLKITGMCGKANDGYICLKSHRDKLVHLWAKNPHNITLINLIGEIAARGGNFYNAPGYIAINPHTRQPCCGGNPIPANPHPYIGARCFASPDEAISYLKVYFLVIACTSNRKYTDNYICKL